MFPPQDREMCLALNMVYLALRPPGHLLDPGEVGFNLLIKLPVFKTPTCCLADWFRNSGNHM